MDSLYQTLNHQNHQNHLLVLMIQIIKYLIQQLFFGQYYLEIFYLLIFYEQAREKVFFNIVIIFVVDDVMFFEWINKENCLDNKWIIFA
jgi:hypothetical protein